MYHRYRRIIALSLCLVQILCVSEVVASSLVEGEQINTSSNQLQQQKVSDTDREEFYIFSVGQGNSQLAVYEKSGFAVLYDCGSSSQQIHPKFRGCFMEEFTPLFKWVKKDIHAEASALSQHKDEDMEIDFEEYSSSSITSNPNMYSSEETKTITDLIKKRIHNIISSFNINHLFIFLSHPDKDHINYISNEIIPYQAGLGQQLEVTAYLGGAWLQGGGTQESREVLKYLIRRGAWIELPFYWDYQNNDGSIISNYATLKQNIFDSVANTGEDENLNFLHNDDSCFSDYPLHSPNLFQNSFLKLLHETFFRNNDFLDHLKGLGFKDENLPENVKNGLDMIHILSLNHGSMDVNNQSTVLSFYMPSMNMNFICTGDASADTFVPINYDHLPPSLQDGSGNHALLMLPHHGAKDNWIPKALKLFHPSLFGISCANGKQYGHPSKDLIDNAYNTYLNKMNISKIVEPVGPISNAFLTFTGSGEGAETGHMIHDDRHILCTNILNSIKFDKQGIYGSFSNIIQCKDFTFEIDLRNRVELSIGILPPLIPDFENENFFWNVAQSQLYVAIDLNKELIYPTKKLADSIQ